MNGSASTCRRRRGSYQALTRPNAHAPKHQRPCVWCVRLLLCTAAVGMQLRVTTRGRVTPGRRCLRSLRTAHSNDTRHHGEPRNGPRVRALTRAKTPARRSRVTRFSPCATARAAPPHPLEACPPVRQRRKLPIGRPPSRLLPLLRARAAHSQDLELRHRHPYMQLRCLPPPLPCPCRPSAPLIQRGE